MDSEYNQCKVCRGDVTLVNTKYNLVKCQDCEIVFCKSIYTQDHFKKVYNKLYNTTSQYQVHLEEFENLKSNKKVKIGRVKFYVLKYILGKDINCLAEIGAGVGIIASYCKKNKISYQGVELDKETVMRSKSIGLSIVEGDFTRLKTFNDDLPAVVAFEVIEHLQDLNQLFLILNKKLASNGYFGFTVPNYDKRLNYSDHGNRIYQSPPPIHLNYFTITSIRKVAENYGFKIVFCKAKRFPYVSWKHKSFYINAFKGVFGTFHGPTLYAVIQKK